mgnify:CR=1 FL=1
MTSPERENLINSNYNVNETNDPYVIISENSNNNIYNNNNNAQTYSHYINPGTPNRERRRRIKFKEDFPRYNNLPVGNRHPSEKLYNSITLNFKDPSEYEKLVYINKHISNNDLLQIGYEYDNLVESLSISLRDPLTGLDIEIENVKKINQKNK